MTNKEEQAYIEGGRRARINLLSVLLHELGAANDPLVEHTKWVQEKQETIAALRSVCSEFGDNDWSDDLYLPDVIEKHLARYLRKA